MCIRDSSYGCFASFKAATDTLDSLAATGQLGSVPAVSVEMCIRDRHVIPFKKCFTGLVGAFTPEEVIFMLYMADRTRLREKGYDTLRSKRYLSLIHI